MRSESRFIIFLFSKNTHCPKENRIKNRVFYLFKKIRPLDFWKKSLQGNKKENDGVFWEFPYTAIFRQSDKPGQESTEKSVGIICTNIFCRIFKSFLQRHFSTDERLFAKICRFCSSVYTIMKIWIVKITWSVFSHCRILWTGFAKPILYVIFLKCSAIVKIGTNVFSHKSGRFCPKKCKKL